MAHLSPAASIVLDYARAHQIDGFAEINDDIQLPDRIVISACKELKSKGKILDFACSDLAVEYIRLRF